jgi:hypothetical protein
LGEVEENLSFYGFIIRILSFDNSKEEALLSAWFDLMDFTDFASNKSKFSSLVGLFYVVFCLLNTIFYSYKFKS